ncbi:hypothetical protein HC757_17095 [Shewanella sp. SHSM-M6]|uniref:Transposase IS200-like domain-containing protein n=1 Tax=Shewanella salipaludis TaxID=2723052 RepID=A0A972JMU6_9GAMM|nr:hypothetical protein [Shewanella salipaludis]
MMSNHYHLVLKIDLAAQKGLSPFNVVARWTTLFSGNAIVTKYLKGDIYPCNPRIFCIIFNM